MSRMACVWFERGDLWGEGGCCGGGWFLFNVFHRFFSAIPSMGFIYADGDSCMGWVLGVYGRAVALYLHVVVSTKRLTDLWLL